MGTEEQALAAELLAYKLLSVSSKLVAIALDKNRRSAIKREDLIEFFDALDSTCENRIRMMEGLSYVRKFQ